MNREVETIIHLAKTWGFTEKEIRRCMDAALAKPKPRVRETTKKTKTSKPPGWSTLKWLVCVVVSTLALTSALLCCETGSEILLKMPISEETVMNGRYHVMRYYRCTVVHIATFFRLQKFYNAECIVKNPLFNLESDGMCDLCADVNNVNQIKPMKTMDLSLLGAPSILKQIMPSSVSVEKLASTILAYGRSLPDTLDSTETWSSTVQQFASNADAEELLKSTQFHFHWWSGDNLAVGQLMRTIFPKPKSFEKTEMSFYKHIFVDGSHGEKYSLVDTDMAGLNFYAQGSGSRTLRFTPISSCADKCSAFEVIVDERDVVTYMPQEWNVELLPDNKTVSVGFLSYILY